MPNDTQSNILIVDDIAANVDYLKILIEPLNVNILSANSGKDALEIIKGKELAVGLIDINMPVMNGIELTRIITSDSSRDRVPIIFITAYYNDEKLLKQCYEAGGVDYILKPFTKEILLSKVNLFLVLDQQKRQLVQSKLKMENLTSELKNIFDLSIDLVCIFDVSTYQFLKVNPAFSKTLGFDTAELTGKRFIELLHPEDKLSTMEKISEAQKSGLDEIRFENRFLCADGSYKWLYWVSRPVWDRGIAYAISHDVTIRKHNEEKIRESEKLYRTLVNASPEGIIITDLDWIITDVSDLTIDLLDGVTRDEFMGTAFSEIIDEVDAARLQDIIERTIEEGLVQSEEFILLTKRNIRLITEISLTMIQHSDGRPKAFMAIIRDIRRRKEIEQQLIHSERLSGIGEIASSIAHEINQPLNNISLSLDNILYSIDKQSVVDDRYLKEKSKNIFDNVHRMEYIIDHIRAFSRSGDEAFPSRFDVNESIKNAVMLVSEQYNNRAILLNLDLNPEIPCLLGNTYKFEQVIINLLTNARDAVEEKKQGAGTSYIPEVRITTLFTDSTLNIKVCDNGTGIPHDLREKIMMPFFTTKESGKGTGLGLSITARIIGEMHGEIMIESQQSSGTCVLLKFPVNSDK